MRRYVLKQLGYGAISLFLLSVTIFIVVRATGDPTMLIVGPGGRPEDYEGPDRVGTGPISAGPVPQLCKPPGARGFRQLLPVPCPRA
jgi:hypothetical protein